MNPLYSAARFVLNAAFGILTGWEVKGRENVPRRGGLIVACNHASFWDPPLVGAALPRNAHILAKEELFSNPVLGFVLRSVSAIPIRRGAADLSGLARTTEVLRRGGVMMLFPEGSRMRDGALHSARPGIGLMAVQADVAIVPCYVSGSNRPRRWWLRRERVRISFGHARRWTDLAGEASGLPPGRALYQAVGDGVMREIARLKETQ